MTNGLNYSFGEMEIPDGSFPPPLPTSEAQESICDRCPNMVGNACVLLATLNKAADQEYDIATAMDLDNEISTRVGVRSNTYRRVALLAENAREQYENNCPASIVAENQDTFLGSVIRNHLRETASV